MASFTGILIVWLACVVGTAASTRCDISSKNSTAPAAALHLAGLGSVGRVVIDQLLRWRARSGAFGGSACRRRLDIVSVADSSGVVAAAGGLSEELLRSLISLKEKGGVLADAELQPEPAPAHDPSASAGGRARFIAARNVAASTLMRVSALRSVVVVADCSASFAPAHRAHLRAARASGASLVFANKKPLADGSMQLFEQLAGGGTTEPLLSSSRLEATVGAGLPVISALQRQLLAGDRIISIEGILSGTLGYVLDRMSGSSGGHSDTPESFSAAVRAAMNAGYTEPDPREDLGGVDVARKAVILARAAIAGGHLKAVDQELRMQNVGLESLVPAAMQADKGIGVRRFVDELLPTLDPAMAQRAEAARAANKVLRYVGKVEFSAPSSGDSKSGVGSVKSVRCGIEAVSFDSPLAQLHGTDNMVVLTSEMYPKGAPLVVRGAGAGRAVTAAAVVADILELIGCR